MMESSTLHKPILGRAVTSAVRCSSYIVPTLRRRLVCIGRRTVPAPGMMGLLIALIVMWSSLVSAQIQQAWVAKYNNGITNGNHQALKMALDSSGNIYVLGVSANANTNTGYAVVKYAPNGNQLWAARYDSTNFPTATPTGFALDNSNNVVVIGTAVTIKYDVNGNLLWTVPYSAQAVAVDSGQNICMTGVFSNFTTVKLDSSGSNLWTKTWSYSAATSVSQVIAVDLSKNVYVAGGENLYVTPSGYAMVGIIKYDENGNQMWENNLSSGSIPPSAQAVGLTIGVSNTLYLEYNYVEGTPPAGFNTTKINSTGSVAWNDYNPTGNGASFGTALIIDSAGNVIIVGQNAYYPPLTIVMAHMQTRYQWKLPMDISLSDEFIWRKRSAQHWRLIRPIVSTSQESRHLPISPMTSQR